jgi:hypothetical protein
MTTVKTHTFHGRKYKIDIDPGRIDGVCDQYKCDERVMCLFADLKTQAGLISAIHEGLHASNWAATEEVVDRVSTDIGRFLWRLGYRLEDTNEGR